MRYGISTNRNSSLLSQRTICASDSKIRSPKCRLSQLRELSSARNYSLSTHVNVVTQAMVAMYHKKGSDNPRSGIKADGRDSIERPS